MPSNSCPKCRKPITLQTIHPIFIDLSDSAVTDQLLAAQVSSLTDMMRSRDKKTEDAMKQMQESLEKMSITMKRFETQNEKLRTENEELKSVSLAQRGLALQPEASSASTANYKEVLKVKDATINSLMKENAEMRAQRIENTREMNAVRSQIDQLKNASTGEMRRLGEGEEPRQLNLTLKFDQVNDKL